MRTLLLLTAASAAWVGADTPVDIERQTVAQLLTLKRVHVDRLAGGDTANQIRDMLISSLQAAKLFILTENQERADAIIRGSAEDLIFTDAFSSSDGLSARTSFNLGSINRSSVNRRGVSGSAGVSDNESSRVQERKHEATAAVRLVNKDGDVIWSTTQESFGAKFRGASADVAEKVTKQLVEDYERARKLSHQTNK